METYRINLNSPRMESRVLLSTTDNVADVTVTTYTQSNGDEFMAFDINNASKLGINVGDVIYFRKTIGEKVYTELPVKVRAITETGFVTDIPGHDVVVSITGVDVEESDASCVLTTIYLDESYAFLPGDYTKLNNQITATTTSFNAGSWTLSPVYRKYNTSCRETAEEYDVNELNTRAFGIDSSVFSDMTEEERDKILPLVFTTKINRFFYETGVLDEGVSVCTLFDNVEIIKRMGYYELKTSIYCNDEINLLKENTIRDVFTEEIKNKIIPPFVDMEKMMYEPCISSFGDIAAEEIVFHFNFREREEDKAWSVKPDGWWNNYTFGHYDGSLSSDTMNNMGFNDDDLHYQTMRLKKSFIRLSFYDTDNPLTQQLLYYSTIFLDSGELFGKYIIEATKKQNDEPVCSVVPCSFSVKSRHNTEKSSEGFYLYLFPSETPLNAAPRDIYMKVEFNHAGYGRTIQMLKPNIDVASERVHGVELDEYYKYQFIKLAAKRLPGDELNYIYYVNEDSDGIKIDYNNKKINFYLFEAKVV